MKKALLALAIVGTSARTFALDAAANTAIDGAFTSGETSVTAVVVGVIGLTALVTGAMLVMKFLSK